MITIDECANGFIVSHTEEDTDQKYVFNWAEKEDHCVLESLADMLHLVLLLLGYPGYKHDHERIKITVEKQ